MSRYDIAINPMHGEAHGSHLLKVLRDIDARLSKLEAEAAKPKDCELVTPSDGVVRENFDANVVQCAIDKNAWRVEAFDMKDGGCFVTIFDGPEARMRAIEYAGKKYRSFTTTAPAPAPAPKTRDAGWYWVKQLAMMTNFEPDFWSGKSWRRRPDFADHEIIGPRIQEPEE